jgi:transposase-like protein
LSKVSKKSTLLKRALELYNQDYTMVNICKELDINVSTLRRWLRKEGVTPKVNSHGENPRPDDPDPLKTALEDNLENKTEEAIKVAKHDARVAEDEAMMELAESKSSPAEKYQSYVAASGIRLLRDSMKNLRGPRSVRELSELDQLIRRNLGLNAKNAGGSGGLQIDISILNNTKADRGGGSVKINPKKVIDIEPEPPE